MPLYEVLFIGDSSVLPRHWGKGRKWLEAGVAQTYHAHSDAEAEEILQTCPIDILVTHAQCKSVDLKRLLAKSAIVRHLKQLILPDAPADEDELVRMVKAMIAEIDASWRSNIFRVREFYSIDDHIRVLQKYFFRGTINGRTLPPDQQEKALQLLGFDVAIGKPFRLVLIRVDEYFGHFDHHSFNSIDNAFLNIAELLFIEDFHMFHCIDFQNYMVLMLSPKDGAAGQGDPFEHIEHLVVRLQHYAKRYLEIRTSILISQQGVFPDDIAAVFSDSSDALRHRIGDEQELLLVDKTFETVPKVRHLAPLYEQPGIVVLLETGKWEQLTDKLSSVFEELHVHWKGSHEHLLETFFRIASGFTYFIHKNNLTLSQVLGDEYGRMLKFEFHTIQQLREWTMRCIEHLKSHHKQQVQDSRSLIIKQVHDYIEEHLDEASLHSIARHVYLNPTYLSKVYKSETGQSLSEYIFRKRMERAADMLSRTNRKVYEIAQELGYVKPSYFIKLFKDYYGTTPQEYRDSMK